MGIPSEQQLWREGISEKEWLNNHDKEIYNQALDDFMDECWNLVKEDEDMYGYFTIEDLKIVMNRIKKKNVFHRHRVGESELLRMIKSGEGLPIYG